jgi:hypothetical protein
MTLTSISVHLQQVMVNIGEKMVLHVWRRGSVNLYALRILESLKAGVSHLLVQPFVHAPVDNFDLACSGLSDAAS